MSGQWDLPFKTSLSYPLYFSEGLDLQIGVIVHWDSEVVIDIQCIHFAQKTYPRHMSQGSQCRQSDIHFMH